MITTKLVLPGGHKLSVTSTAPLSTPVERALICVHGVDRNRDEYARWAVDGAKKAHADVLVVAPLFDSAWSSDEWRDGTGGPVSSYAAMDQLLGALAAKTVVLCGHSAGGQFVQRHAMVGSVAASSYVVMNPSSYGYLSAWRPVAKPCRGFDSWKYGLSKRTGYVGTLTNAEVATRYTSRAVTIANGSLDTTSAHSMDTSCAAMAQGKNRFVRGQVYAEQIAAMYPSAPHTRIVVPGVGHDGQAMLAAPALRGVLYGASSI